MKAFFLTALCALTLVACGGNQNNKTKEPAAEPATEQDLQDVQDLQDELEAPIPQGSDGIAFEFYKLRLAHLGEDVDDEECPEGVTLTYTHSMDDIEGYFADGTHSCFPLSGGGWMFVYEGIEAAEGSPGFFTYETYTYKDGELTEVQALPIPAFDEIFDEDAVDPGNRDLIPRLKANYKERPRDFLTYDVEPFDGTVVARLNPVDAEAEMETGAWLECYWEYRRDYSDTPVYHWNGKAFVK